MESETGVTQSIFDELHSSDIQGGQMDGGNGVTRSFIDEHHSSDIQGDQMEVESGVIRSIIDELLLRLSNEIKWKVKMVLLEVSLMNLILWIS